MKSQYVVKIRILQDGIFAENHFGVGSIDFVQIFLSYFATMSDSLVVVSDAFLGQLELHDLLKNLVIYAIIFLPFCAALQPSFSKRLLSSASHSSFFRKDRFILYDFLWLDYSISFVFNQRKQSILLQLFF